MPIDAASMVAREPSISMKRERHTVTLCDAIFDAVVTDTNPALTKSD